MEILQSLTQVRESYGYVVCKDWFDLNLRKLVELPVKGHDVFQYN